CQIQKKVGRVTDTSRKVTSPSVKKKLYPATKTNRESQLQHLVLIGTSTGGPKALQQDLLTLPKMENTAIVIVQHMPPTFTKSLANRLNQITEHRVTEAIDGEQIVGGHVYIAPGGYHLHLHPGEKGELRFRLSQEPPRKGHRPAVDVLY